MGTGRHCGAERWQATRSRDGYEEEAEHGTLRSRIKKERRIKGTDTGAHARCVFSPLTTLAIVYTVP